jgi:hypothetical protein
MTRPVSLTLVNGTESFRPVIASRNLIGVSRKLVPIAESRFVLILRFWDNAPPEGRLHRDGREDSLSVHCSVN